MNENENATDQIEDKTEMTRDEAEKLLKKWGDMLEVDTSLDSFRDVLDELTLPVMLGRLDYDVAKECFVYRLIKPIKHSNSIREIIEIREVSFEQNKVLDRIADSKSVEQATAMLGRRTGLHISEVEKLYDRDIYKINAVILGFFGQNKSSK